MDIDCENCGEDIKFGDAKCYKCGMPYDEQFWRDFYNELWNSIPEEPEENDDEVEDVFNLRLNAARYLDETHNICCDQYWEICKCNYPIDFESIYHDLSPEVYEDIYSQTSKCSSCIHFYTPTCGPLRLWVRAYYESARNGQEPINPGMIDDICDMYDSYENYDEETVRRIDAENKERIADAMIYKDRYMMEPVD